MPTQNCSIRLDADRGAIKTEVADAVRAVLYKYPASGLPDGTDSDAFTVVEDGLASSGVARVEHRIVGQFARFMSVDGGRPCVENLLFEIGGDGREVGEASGGAASPGRSAASSSMGRLRGFTSDMALERDSSQGWVGAGCWCFT